MHVVSKSSTSNKHSDVYVACNLGLIILSAQVMHEVNKKDHCLRTPVCLYKKRTTLYMSGSRFATSMQGQGDTATHNSLPACLYQAAPRFSFLLAKLGVLGLVSGFSDGSAKYGWSKLGMGRACRFAQHNIPELWSCGVPECFLHV